MPTSIRSYFVGDLNFSTPYHQNQAPKPSTTDLSLASLAAAGTRVSQGKRRLAAIMFTDMVGYTALGQSNESLSLALVEEQRKLIRPILGKHNGREVKTMGDAFLVEFASALEAVRCAYDIQRAIRDFNFSLPEDRRIHLRVGVHLGDIVESQGDISGDAVNVASRIETLAEDGGVWLTRQVYDQVVNKLDLPLAGVGTKRLKNVSTPIEVYKVVMPWSETKESPVARLDRNRVAVLPFANMSPDPADEYFADGLTEEIISTLSKVEGIDVISRMSVMQYRKNPKPIREISGELGVARVLEGSVRKAGKRLRITVQMVDATSDRHLWVESYDRELEDIFVIQSDIAQRVARALKAKAHPVSQEGPTRRSRATTEAYEMYLRGRYFWNRGTMDWFMKALEQFEGAIEKDPQYAPAYSGLADTYLLLGRNGHVTPKFAYPKAVQYASKALALDDTLAQPHVALAAIRQEYEWKWEEAESEFKLAIEANPSYATAHGWFALYLGHVGRFDEAIAEVNRAQELDPLSPRIHCNASEEYLFARDFDKALEAAERALEIDPSYGGAHGYAGYAYVEKGLYDKAIEEFQEAGKMQGARAWMGRLGHVYGVSGNQEEAMRILDELKKVPVQPPPKSPFIPPPPSTSFDVGLVYLGLGEHDRAIVWLKKATDERTAEIIHVKCEPIYAKIREEPGFQELLNTIGLAN
jgi:adenylate cyclase